MVKSRILGSTIEIWSADYINKTYMRKEEDKDAEVIQAERANNTGTMFIVEVVRKKTEDDYYKVDFGITTEGDRYISNIMLCKEEKYGNERSVMV